MWLLFGTNNERVSTFFHSCMVLFPLDTATFIPKRELSSFTPEEIKQSLHKERDNLISTGTLEAIPKNEWNSIPKNKQITSHTFTEVKSDNTLKSRTVAHGNKQTPETYTIFSYGTIHHVTINLLLVKALNMNIIPYQIDIGHAFLDGKIMKLWAHASLFRSPPPLFSSLLPDYLH